MKKSYITSNVIRLNDKYKTLAVIDREKFKSHIVWMNKIQNVNYKTFKQLSNHVLLVDIQKTNSSNKYQCYISTITSTKKCINLFYNDKIDLIEAPLINGEKRYIPEVIYKIILSKTEILNFLNLNNQRSQELSNTIKYWDKNSILNVWLNKAKGMTLIDLDITKETGVLDVSDFKDQLSESNINIDMMKELIIKDEL